MKSTKSAYDSLLEYLEFDYTDQDLESMISHMRINRAITEAVQAEREECAKIADDVWHRPEVAAMIRSRSKETL